MTETVKPQETELTEEEAIINELNHLGRAFKEGHSKFCKDLEDADKISKNALVRMLKNVLGYPLEESGTTTSEAETELTNQAFEVSTYKAKYHIQAIVYEGYKQRQDSENKGE